MRSENMFCVVLFGLFSVTLVRSALTGMFKTECRDRHFWLSVKSHFLGSKFWFEVRGESGVRPVDGQWAAECGYTLQRDSWGDLTLRASYLACTVDNQGDSEFRLMLWFVNQGADGEGMSHHPLLLSCSLPEPWRPREVVCENNYMEVSVEKRVPADNHRGTEWVTPAPADDTLREWRVLFRVPDLRLRLGSGFPPLKEEIIPVNLVHLLGYSINTTASRIVLRCSYGSRLAYTLQGGDFTVEVVSTTIIYRHHWTLLRVDMSVACATTQGSLDGADVVWTLPWLLHPLVVPPVGQKNLKVAVGGRYITQCMARYRDYRIHDDNNTVEIRIPFGAEGGRLKSGVSAGVYVHLYEVDVELLREWQDSAWKQTQQRTFRTLRVHQNDPINISKHTVPSGEELVLSVGDFLSDVMLVNVTVAGQRFSLEDAERNTIRISQVPFPNGTHSYLLQVPLTHPLITQQVSTHSNVQHFQFTLNSVSPERFVVLDHAHRSLVQVQPVDISDPQLDHAFCLTLLENHQGNTCERLLKANTESDLHRWTAAFPAVSAQQEKQEKVYEDWDCPQVQCIRQYSAKQVDELSLECCDIINIIRKTNEGWYEGLRLSDRARGWFPQDSVTEVTNEHQRRRNLREQYRIAMATQTANHRAEV
ncbi:hypothetical protein SRHO_G00294670 [Serrasalmus rhombeus]